jgi:hypothetical protein
MLQAASANAQGGRDIEPQAAARQREGVLYGDSWAVVIGIDRYLHAPRLTYAVTDARSVAATLPRFGFTKIIIIENEKATAREIRRLLGDDLPRQVKKNDRVVVFFAGHGATRELAPGRDMGYLVPVDGDLETLHATSISMREITDFAELIDARHVLFLIDACYGGLAFRDATVPPKYPGYLTDLVRKPVKQIITAGGKDERVIEEGGHGLFTRFLLRALDGEADDGDGIVTAMQLGSYLQKRVAEASSRYGKGHTPLYGRLAGDGDFVFVRPGAKISTLLLGSDPTRTSSPPAIIPTPPASPPPSARPPAVATVPPRDEDQLRRDAYRKLQERFTGLLAEWDRRILELYRGSCGFSCGDPIGRFVFSLIDGFHLRAERVEFGRYLSEVKGTVLFADWPIQELNVSLRAADIFGLGATQRIIIRLKTAEVYSTQHLDSERAKQLLDILKRSQELAERGR